MALKRQKNKKNKQIIQIIGKYAYPDLSRRHEVNFYYEMNVQTVMDINSINNIKRNNDISRKIIELQKDLSYM